MFQKTEYSKKLADPRWQKKRLLILERDQFVCKWCFNDESTLHVHHLWYVPGDPWDAPDEALITLCDSCHSLETETRPHAEQKLLKVFKETKKSALDIYEIGESIRNSGLWDDYTWSILVWAITSVDAREVVAKMYSKYIEAFKESRRKQNE